MKVAVFILTAILLVGCEEQYRYSCQDPNNWEKQECKKPWCSANGTCPEDLIPYEKQYLNGAPTPPQQNDTKRGECR
jgi:hypothetical protein